MKSAAFTVESEQGLLRELKTTIGVSQPFIGMSKEELKIESVTALWDTGATGTVITKRVADLLGLEPISLAIMHTANGSCEKNVYLVNVLLPNNVGVQGVRVAEADLNEDLDMLIGMDIITLGDFIISNCRGSTCFSFRIPSVKRVDYVEETQE